MSDQHFTITADDDLFDLSGGAPVIVSAPANDALGVAERTMIVDGAATTITTVQGVAIGTVAGSYVRVFLAQLRLPAEGGLRAGYDRKSDPRFELLKESINQTGINIEPLICDVTGEVTEIDGQPRPILIVRSGERRYWALKELAKPEALVRVLPQDMSERGKLLFILIDNEMQAPLPLLDRCDYVAMLIDEHHMRQQVVAAHLGYGQSQVSRLYMAAHQPTLIRTYLAAESLKLEPLEKINRAFSDDETMRETVARYIVQEGLQGNAIDNLLLDLAPPAGLKPRFALIAPPADAEHGRVTVQSLIADTKKSEPPQHKSLPYWKRSAPLIASAVRLLNNRHEAIVSGPPSNPVVALGTLAGPQLFRQLDRQKATTVELEALEEAYLADLEAIRAALEDEGDTANAPVQLTRVVDADPNARKA